jgi:predicted lipoprotein
MMTCIPLKQLKRFLFSVALSFSLLAALPVEADESPVTTASIIEQTLTTIYQPRFAQFALVTLRHDEAAQAYCANPSHGTLTRLYKEFESVVASFSAIELYRVGPLLQVNRQNRLFYWPDKRRVVERQLRTLLAGLTNNTLSVDDLSQKSVALQGLPALERLLFGKNAAQRLLAGSETNNCELIIAIADNVNTMAVAINADWQADSLLVQSILHPESGSDYFRDDKEVLRSIVTQIIVGVDVVLNRKIASLHGNDAGIKKAPLWRSEQSLSMISNNLESLRALTVDSGLARATNLGNELAFEFRIAGQMVQKLIDLPSLIDEHGNLSADAQSLVRALSAVVGGVKDTLNDRFTQALGIRVGFNSEDGD